MSGIYRDEVKRGQRVDAGWMNDASRRVVNGIVAGPGLARQQVGKGLVLTARENKRRSGLSCPMVEALPEIPESGMALCYWATAEELEGATGDGQIWTAYAGQTEWTPMQHYTDSSGVVV